ncbi:MAG TPA: prepilin-type N-terminal cleavage/methylation domain-containing protein [Candidatus Eisenbacteria bacterium]|jgi:prepilin-type N-terminal cleavage/methylation domain-containing protein|nr:prepilin-type N-terminal cleavage/methylation domain-containing protein [Candidatus Eisenbacteria bacterium]
MHRATESDEAGFSLAEIVIVIVVVSIAAYVFTGMFLQAVKSYEYIDAEKQMLQEARYAEERLSRELKRVRGNTFVTQATSRTFTFFDRDSAAVSVSWTGVKGDPLLYTKNGTPQTLASGVDTLAFTYYKNDGSSAAPLVAPAATDIWRVKVDLRLAKNSQTVSAQTAVFLRSM